MKGAVGITTEAESARFTITWRTRPAGSAAVPFGKMAVVFSSDIMYNYSNQH